MVMLTYEQPVKATHHTANLQAQKGQHLTDPQLREVQVPQQTVTPLRTHAVVPSTLHLEGAALPRREAHKQTVVGVVQPVAKAHTGQALQNHQHIHPPDHPASQVQRVATLILLQAHQEAQGAALLQVLHPVQEEAAIVHQEVVADRPEAQDN